LDRHPTAFAFDHLKNLLCVAPVVAYQDLNARFYLATDASVPGLGAIIYQLSDGHPRHIAYISHASVMLNLTGEIPEKERYAFIYSLERFKPHLYGPQFTWITDAKCLTWLDCVKDTSPKLLSWCSRLKASTFLSDINLARIMSWRMHYHELASILHPKPPKATPCRIPCSLPYSLPC
jgi:hypothetical protein